MVVPSYTEILYKINTLKNNIHRNMYNRINQEKMYLKNLEGKIRLYSPQNYINSNYQLLDYLTEKLINNINSRMTNKRHDLILVTQKLDNLSPLKTISRGFAAIVKEEKLVKSIKQVKKDDIIDVYFYDGKLECKIDNVVEGKNGKSKEKEMTFEEAIKRLEEIVYEIEDKNLSLEDSILKFKEGMELANFCNKKLDEAERKINVLIKNEEGELVEEDFEFKEENDGI